jgi:hypothetical protein
VIWTNSYYKTKFTKIEFDAFAASNKQIFVFVDSENAERAKGIIPKKKNIKIFYTAFPWLSVVSKILEHESERLFYVEQYNIAKSATSMMMNQFSSVFNFHSQHLLGIKF